MPLISGTVPSLINGVSQQPATLRMNTQGESQTNALAHIARGLEKRPCTEHVAEIEDITSTNSNDVFIHTIRRSEDEAYALIIKGGSNATNASMKLIDLTGFATGTAGSEVFVRQEDEGTDVITESEALDSTVASYLGNFGSSFTPNLLSSTTVADFTFILNKTRKVKKITTDVPDTGDADRTRNYEGLVYLKVGDYGAEYTVTVTMYPNGLEATKGDYYEIKYKAPDNKTESLSGTGDYSNVLSINNQNSVLIHRIAKALNTGLVDPELERVKLVAVDAGDETPPDKKAQVQEIDGTPYTEDYGVISTGSVDSKKYEYTTGGDPDPDWIEDTSYSALGLTNIPGIEGSLDEGSSVIYLSHETVPFTIEVTDGKGDIYMKAITGHDEVPKFSDLPASKVPDGFTARISGDKNSAQDDYYVKWKGSVYKETFKPKYPADHEKDNRYQIDASTMPMQLYKAFGNVGSGVSSMDKIYFVCKAVDWADRTVGDDTTNPFPSFVDYDDTVDTAGLYTINDIFFHRNRLGFISDENVILSEAAGYFNFFANTVLSVLDTSVIDVAVSNNQVAILKSAIPFQENLLLFSDLQQFKLTSDQFLTPTSVTVDVATNFETSTETKPVAAGKTIFFPFQRGSFSGVREYTIDIASETNDANEVTAHVPEYIGGTVKKMAVSSNEEVLFVLSDTDRKELVVYKYYYSDQEKLQSCWSKWRFDAEIVDVEFVGSVAFILFRRGSKIYLEKLNLSVDNATAYMDDQIGVRLDRRVRLYTGGTTTTPYDDHQFDKVGVASADGLYSTCAVKGDFTNAGTTRIKIDGVTNKPRIGQTFTYADEAVAVYTITASTDVSSNECEITITPSIGPSTASGAGFLDDKVITFKERPLVYIKETGVELKYSESTDLSSFLSSGDEFTTQKGSATPYTVFVGVPYDFEYEFSEQFVKSGEDSINSGRLQMRNFEVSYANTGYFSVQVSPKPFDDRVRTIYTSTFTGQTIGSTKLGEKSLDTGVFRVPVYCNSKDVKIKVNSDQWFPLALQSADWEAFQVLRNQRI